MLVSNQLHGFNRAKPRMRYSGGIDLDYYTGSFAIRTNSSSKTGIIYGNSGYFFPVGPKSQDKCILITNYAKFGTNNPYLPDDFGGVGSFQLALAPTVSTAYTDGLLGISYLTVKRIDPNSTTMECWAIGTRLVRIPEAQSIEIGSTYFKTKQITLPSGTEAGTIAVEQSNYPVYTDFEAMEYITFNYEGDINKAALYGFSSSDNTGAPSKTGHAGSIVYVSSGVSSSTGKPAANFNTVISGVPNDQWNYNWYNSNDNAFFQDIDSGNLEYGLGSAVFSPNSYDDRIYFPTWSNNPERILTQVIVLRP